MRREERRLVEELLQRLPEVGRVDDGEERCSLVAELSHAADHAAAALRPAVAQAREPLAQLLGRLDGLGRQADGRQHRDQARDRLHLHLRRLARREHEPVVEEAVLGVVEALPFERAGDQNELLEELDHHVQVDVVLLRELDRDHEHRERVVGHPGGAVGLLERDAFGEVGAVDRADVVEPEEAAAEDVVAVGVLRG